jgi:hypothetical protein
MLFGRKIWIHGIPYGKMKISEDIGKRSVGQCNFAGTLKESFSGTEEFLH